MRIYRISHRTSLDGVHAEMLQNISSVFISDFYNSILLRLSPGINTLVTRLHQRGGFGLLIGRVAEEMSRISTRAQFDHDGEYTGFDQMVIRHERGVVATEKMDTFFEVNESISCLMHM